MTARKKNASQNNNPVILNSHPQIVLKVKHVSPITQTQNEVFQSYAAGKNLWLTGSAGTGKTFIAMYLALRDILEGTCNQHKLVIFRSIVPVRDPGALPGELEDKIAPFEDPYDEIANKLFECPKPYKNLKAFEHLEFRVTSFVRGSTIDNAIILVDEASNLNYHELDSIITRVGKNSRIIFCGDRRQSDFTKKAEKDGYEDFEKVIERMRSFDIIDFTPADIVRSGLVKEYLLAADR